MVFAGVVGRKREGCAKRKGMMEWVRMGWGLGGSIGRREKLKCVFIRMKWYC